MLALRKLAAGSHQITLIEIADPRPLPGHVTLAVKAAGLCGTDIHILRDEFPSRPPVTLGHEVTGEIMALGDGVDQFHVGDRVVTETYYSTCRRCVWCRSGLPNLCDDRRSIGSAVDGGFAEYLTVPATGLHEIPHHLSWRAAAMLEPLACTVHGLQNTPLWPGQWVVISGPGPMGLLAQQVAQAAGCRVVMIGTDQDSHRLAVASELGAITRRSGEDGLAEDIMTVTEGGAPVVLECSGAAQAARMLTRVVRKRGHYAQIGLFGLPVPFVMDAVCYKELTLSGTNASIPSVWPMAMDLLAKGVVKTEPLISEVFHLTDWAKALGALQAHDALKVMLTPDPQFPGLDTNLK